MDDISEQTELKGDERCIIYIIYIYLFIYLINLFINLLSIYMYIYPFLLLTPQVIKTRVRLQPSLKAEKKTY